MFDLDKEIHAWCRTVHSGLKRSSGIAELTDHVYCEVERLMQEGLSEEQAFLEATARIGNVEELRTEHSKNRSPVSRFFHQSEDYLQAWGASLSLKKIGVLQIVLSLVFATVIMLSALIMEEKDDSQLVMYLTIALWWGPYSFLCSLAAKSKRPCLDSEDA